MLAPVRASLAAIIAFQVAFTNFAHPAQARETRVMCSGGFSAALDRLAQSYEKEGDRLVIIHGPSMGTTHDAIPARLARGETCDVLIMVGSALDSLHDKGLAGKSIVLADSRIGVVVREGAQHPDISTETALRNTLLAAPSVAYSDSASGVYVAKTLFDRLGIADQMKTRAHEVQEIPVARIVAEGNASLGLQQISEILPVSGASLVGPIPENLQKITRFSAAICRHSINPEGGKALIRYLSSAQADKVIRASGLDPVHADSESISHE